MGLLKRIPLCLAIVLFATAVHAAQPLPGGYTSGGPIEITSDTLEVFQQENRAIFMGNVVAIQGEVRLKSDKMTVHYKQAPEGEKSKAADQNAIDKIEVEGNVFLTTPEETASGVTGVYDVTNHQIVLNDKVVLTRGKNTLKGEKLVYDFNTGKSVITSGTVTTVKDGKGKERVRALLIPDENKKPAAPAAQEPRKP